MRISDWSSDVCSSDLFRSIPSAMPNLRSYSCRAKSTYATHCFVEFLNLGAAGAFDGCGDDMRYAVAAFDGARFVSMFDHNDLEFTALIPVDGAGLMRYTDAGTTQTETAYCWEHDGRTVNV